MYIEKVLGIVNARYKNAGKRQSMLKNGRNRQSKVKECPEIVNVRRKKKLEIVNVRRKNTRNRQCKVQECWEMTKYAEKILGFVNAS